MKEVILLIVFLVIVIALAPLVLMACWNAVIPDVLGLGTINFGQAFLLNVIASILFKPISYKQDKN